MAVTWNDPIKGQFTGFDISHMKQVTGNALKLDDYESVKTWAGQILDQINSDSMPPGNPWNATYKSNFQSWIDAGCPES